MSKRAEQNRIRKWNRQISSLPNANHELAKMAREMARGKEFVDALVHCSTHCQKSISRWGK